MKRYDSNDRQGKKKVIILTADAGFGHRSAAIAVEAAFREKYEDVCQVDIINPLEDKRTPFFLRDSQSDYDKIVREMPELYRFGYDASDAPLPGAIVESALTVLLFEVMRDIVIQNKPDAILTTYPLYQSPLVALSTLSRQKIPLLTVVTDLAKVHRLWFENNIDACLVPTGLVKNAAIENNIAAEKIHVTGLPVNPSISKEKRSREEVRRQFGWDEGLTTFLVVGSRRVDRRHLMDALHVLNHFGKRVQLVVVAGGDQDLFENLNKIEWHVPVHLYDYTQDMVSFMRASDVMVTKAGGLIVTESMASGLPMILIDVLPGQETGNAQYVVDGGAGERALEPIQMLEIVFHWLENEQQSLKIRAQNAKELGRPLAAYTVADLLWAAAEHGVTRRQWKLTSEITNLVEMLSSFDIRIKENPLLTLRSESQESDGLDRREKQ